MNSPELGGLGGFAGTWSWVKMASSLGLGPRIFTASLDLTEANDQGTDLECEPNFFDADGFVPWDFWEAAWKCMGMAVILGGFSGLFFQ